MKYSDLTIDQKISLKEVIYSKKRREQFGVFKHEYFDGLFCLALLDKNYIYAINIFLVGINQPSYFERRHIEYILNPIEIMDAHIEQRWANLMLQRSAKNVPRETMEKIL